MVVEARDGLLYVFLPPTEELEHFVDLLARIEAAAAKVGCPVVIEGYGPPADPRLTTLTVTPDPGVIEVNVAATASFAEQTRAARTLYEQAREARLATETFAWTAATAAPAAAATSPWAASRPPTPRCCAGPTCWCRC